MTKVYPARETSPRALETDALITVTDVLKGSKSIDRIVISQGGGSKDGLVINPVQYSLAEVGVRCLWFLQEDKRLDAPARDGVNRYFVTGSWPGMLCAEDGRIHVQTRHVDWFRAQYHGKGLDEVKAEVLSVLP
ncbi:MAG: hypothetical protein ACK5AZ_03635 [Bryobacteraceae bacterium]